MASYFLIDGKPTSSEKKGEEYINDAWFWEWINKKTKELSKKFPIRMIFPKSVLENPVHDGEKIKQWPKRGLPITSDFILSAEQGGDGISHSITYYERVMNDVKVPGGKRYILGDGNTQLLNFRRPMTINKGEIYRAIYFCFICSGLGRDYVIEDLKSQAKSNADRETAIAKITLNILTVFDEDEIRIISGGEYEIPGSFLMDIGELRSVLLNKIKDDIGINGDQAIERCKGAVEMNKDIENKYFVLSLFDTKVVFNKTYGRSTFVFSNKSMTGLEEGTKLCKVITQGREIDDLYNWLFLGDQEEQINYLKHNLMERQLKMSDLKPELVKLNMEYHERYGRLAPYLMRNKKDFLEEKIQEKLEAVE